jgi:hypothetical protein
MPLVVYQICAVIVALWPLVGAVGTVLENVGDILKRPRLQAWGQRLEAIFVDWPKVIRGSRITRLLGVEDTASLPANSTAFAKLLLRLVDFLDGKADAESETYARRWRS